MQSVVSIIKCEDYSQDRVNEAVRKAVELAGLSGLLSADKSLLLKPNMLAARAPEDAVTTHPAIVQAIGKIALEHACQVKLGDSPPFQGENEAKYAKLCDTTGMATVAKELRIRIARFEEKVVKANAPQGRMFHSFEIAGAVSDADVLVNIPKLKTHGLTLFSGAVKNIFGCIPGIRKGLFHVQSADDREVFSQMLVDLLAAVKPRINIMDAVIAMEGEGPNGGKPRKVGVILASSDPVALDAVACKIVGIDPMSVHTTRLAHEQRIGCGDISQIEIVGEVLEDVSIKGFVQSSGSNDWVKIPAPIRKSLRKQLIASPVIKASECVGCGDCYRICPVQVIEPGRPPRIDLSKCIRCYCCHEICNYKAIELRRGFLGNLTFKLFRKSNT